MNFNVLSQFGITPTPYSFFHDQNDIVTQTYSFFGGSTQPTEPESFEMMPLNVSIIDDDDINAPLPGRSAVDMDAIRRDLSENTVSPVDAVLAENNSTQTILNSSTAVEGAFEETGEALMTAEAVTDLVDPLAIVGQIGQAASSLMNNLSSNARQSASTSQFVDTMTNGRGYSYSEVARQTLTSQTTGNNTQTAVATGLTALLGPVGALIGNMIPNSVFQPESTVNDTYSDYNQQSVVDSGESDVASYNT